MITREILLDWGFKKYEVSPIDAHYTKNGFYCGPDAFYQLKIKMAGGDDNDLFIDALEYSYVDPSNGHKTISWTFRTQLEWKDEDAFNIETCGWGGKNIEDVIEFFKFQYIFAKSR